MDKLVPMTSADGRMLEVHSSCVHAHERAGWRTAAQADTAAIERTLAAAAELEAAARVRNGLTEAAPEQQKKGGKAAPKE